MVNKGNVDGYREFLEAKKVSSPSYGFDPGDDVSDVLFGFQRDIVRSTVAGYEWWCLCRKALGDCRCECKGFTWCENVRRANRGR